MLAPFAELLTSRPGLALWLWQAQAAPVQPAPTQPPPEAPTVEKVNWYVRIWNEYINRPFQIGDSLKISAASLGAGLLILLAAVVASRLLRRFLEARLATRSHLDPGLQYTILQLSHYFVIIAGALFALSVGLNASLMSFAVVFTALSVGIGFGLQFIAGDIASGFILLFERPVRVGDFITVGVDSKTVEGKVRSINLRTTLVMTNDRIAVIVPNSKLVNDNLVNWSHPDPRSRISITVGVASNSDPELVSATLLRAAEGIEYVLDAPKPSVQLTGFGDFTLDFRLLVWTEHPRRHPKVKSDINFRILRLFREAGIEIPDPKQEVVLSGGRLRVERVGGAGAGLDYGAEEDREGNLARR